MDIAYIFDVTVVKNDRARSAYSEKVNNYRELAERLRKDRGLKRIIITPVVVTTSGLISRYSIQKLIECEFNIKWPPVIRELIIHQMKDIMFYLNQHLDGVELEPGTSSNNPIEVTQNGDVSQGESPQTAEAYHEGNIVTNH